LRLFLAVLAIAGLIGGFIGGRFTGASFSLIWAAAFLLGTGAVLLSLGAFFARQERRKKEEELPPEVRAVFDRMVGKSSSPPPRPKAWRPRAFHENRTKAEQLEWFANAGDWQLVDKRLIRLLVDRLHGNPMFEVLVHASQDCGLVPQYGALTRLFEKGVGEVAALPSIADILCKAGVAQGQRFGEALHSGRSSKDQLSKWYSNAMNVLEAAVHVEPDYITAYLRLAELKRLVGRNDEALQYIQQGLDRAKRIGALPLPDRPDMNLKGGLFESATALESLARELRA
jgi:tetratricopeptide (TPR) repeat protein